MADTANLAIYQGDDYAAVVTVLDSSGNPFDLAGYTAQAQIRRGPADQNPTVMVEIVTLIVPPNEVNLSIPNATTSKLSGKYFWDMQLTATDGTVTTLLAGAALVTPEITREGAAAYVRPVQKSPPVRAVQGHSRPRPAASAPCL
jgi:hypothetical protein